MPHQDFSGLSSLLEMAALLRLVTHSSQFAGSLATEVLHPGANLDHWGALILREAPAAREGWGGAPACERAAASLG